MSCFNEILQNSSGVPIGTVSTRKRPLTHKEREVCQKFVEHLVDGYKHGKEWETMQNNRANVAALAGEIKALKVDEERGFIMIDAGPEANNKKWIKCTVHKDSEVLEKLGRFEKGDYIQVRGYVRAWAQQENGEWGKPQYEVRVEQIANDPPVRKKADTKKKQSAFGDDEIPF